jgi:hypothetical protein
MTLAPGEFIRRFLLHVLPNGFHRIRHYGLLASATCKANIARARELIAAPVAMTDPPTEHDDADLDASAAADHRPPCPCCGGRMVIVETFQTRRRTPRPAIAPSRGQSHDAMTPITASLHLPPAGEPRFRRRIAVAPPPPTARPIPSIRLKLPCRLPRSRQTRHRNRRSAADCAGQRIHNASRCIVKSP